MHNTLKDLNIEVQTLHLKLYQSTIAINAL